MIATRRKQSGFALPTILIASVVMLVVLVSAVSVTAGVRSSLDGQYYNRLAREAAESGIARANQCLQNSGYLVEWSNANSLRPNTTCSGGASCTNSSNCFVMDNSALRTTFTVGLPVDSVASKRVTSIGKVELLRASTGAVWKTYTYTASGRIGVDVNFNTVAFGYSGADSGAYFATISADGQTRAVGFNGYGILGNGTTTNTLTPTNYILNGSDRAVGIYTNFVAVGYNMFVITNQGTVYGSGRNDMGQLGDGSETNRSTPVQFGLPVGVKATNVAVGGRATFVMGNNNRVYATGQCLYGLIGTNEPMHPGCINRTTHGIIALPPPSLANTNTLPTTNLEIDLNTAYIRMQGGRVYGWGRNNWGQLGNNTTTDSGAPLQIGTYGNGGEPKATQIEFDGYTIYILDDQGDVTATGRSEFGQLAGGGAPLALDSNGKCLDDINQGGTTLQLYNCDNTVAQDWRWRTDGTIHNANTNTCINVLADNENVNLATCTNSTRQKWTYRNDRTIMNTATGKCLNNKANDGITVIVYTCVVNPNEYFTIQPAESPVDISLPPGAGDIAKIATDEHFVSVLTDTGEVWSAGRNSQGQLGNGTTSSYQPALVKFILPAGVTAVDVSVSAYYIPSEVSNIFVIGSNGKIYGAGNNASGQLGDGTTTQRSTPVAMNVIDGTVIKAKQVRSGDGTTVILTQGKKIYTVGNNENGQLGDGTTTNSSTPKANKYTNVLPITIF